jgi:hypothetical protein
LAIWLESCLLLHFVGGLIPPDVLLGTAIAPPGSVIETAASRREPENGGCPVHAGRTARARHRNSRIVRVPAGCGAACDRVSARK